MVAGFNETANDGKYQLIYMNVCWTAHFVCTRVSWRRVRLDVEVKYCADQTTDMAPQCCFRMLETIMGCYRTLFNCPEWLPTN